jgi:hypothetical protein
MPPEVVQACDLFFSCRFLFASCAVKLWSRLRADQTPSALGKQLHRAVRENDRGGALEALDSGADPNWTNPSTSTCALHIACKLGHTKIALLLLQRGADVNTQTKTGWIPMHFAVNTGLLELVELLNSYGGRADIVNEWMRTPLDIAKERKNEEMLDILKRRPGVAPVVVPVTPRVEKPAAAATPASNGKPISTATSGGFASSASKIPQKSPRANTILPPTQDAPLPPATLTKPLPATPSDVEAGSNNGTVKVRSIRGGPSSLATGLDRGSGAEWIETTGGTAVTVGSSGSSSGGSAPGVGGSPASAVPPIAAPRTKATGSLSGPSGGRSQDAEIAKLNQEVASLKGDVEYLKQELAKVLTYLQGVDL